MSGDEVAAVELPLAKACEKVLSSMQTVLEKTAKASDEVMSKYDGENSGKKGSVGMGMDGVEGGGLEEKKRHLAKTKATEIRVVRNVADLRCPQVRFRAKAVET